MQMPVPSRVYRIVSLMVIAGCFLPVSTGLVFMFAMSVADQCYLAILIGGPLWLARAQYVAVYHSDPMQAMAAGSLCCVVGIVIAMPIIAVLGFWQVPGYKILGCTIIVLVGVLMLSTAGMNWYWQSVLNRFQKEFDEPQVLPVYPLTRGERRVLLAALVASVCWFVLLVVLMWFEG